MLKSTVVWCVFLIAVLTAAVVVILNPPCFVPTILKTVEGAMAGLIASFIVLLHKQENIRTWASRRKYSIRICTCVWIREFSMGTLAGLILGVLHSILVCLGLT